MTSPTIAFHGVSKSYGPTSSERLRAWSGSTWWLPPAPRAPCSLAGELATQGRSVVVVDLTARLPAAVRGADFRAVKVLVRGLQPLIMLDDEPWSAVSGRVGSQARAGAGPHPLI